MASVAKMEFQARVLVDGSGEGPALVLAEPLSLWGGLDPDTGEVIDRRHAAAGGHMQGRVLVMPIGRGSSSASSILLEAVRQSTAPAAIILAEVDGILALGAAVAREMYDASPPVVVLESADYAQLLAGQQVRVEAGGKVTVTP